MNHVKRVISGRRFPTNLNPYITQAGNNANLTEVLKGNRHIHKFNEPLEITLVGREELATDTFVYRFALPDQSRTLGHGTCQYLEIEADIVNKETG